MLLGEWCRVSHPATPTDNRLRTRMERDLRRRPVTVGAVHARRHEPTRSAETGVATLAAASADVEEHASHHTPSARKESYTSVYRERKALPSPR
jgi:hypothetical protein